MFGREPTPLSALENPALLPAVTDEQKDIQALAQRMADIHEGLREQSDALKAVASAAANVARKTTEPMRHDYIAVGDRVWLLWGDADKVKYKRKHGHGEPWRRSYEVLDVRPNAVLLDVESGSDVLPWQALRNCTKAFPVTHGDHLPFPSGAGDVHLPKDGPHGSLGDDADGPKGDPDPDHRDDPQAAAEGSLAARFPGQGWDIFEADPSRKFEIERIVSAERLRNGGWKYQVKWKGYSDLTPETHSVLVPQIRRSAELMGQADRAREDYLLANPMVAQRIRELEAARDAPPPEPAVRARRSAGAQPPARFDQMIFSVLSAPSHVSSGLAIAANALQKYLQQRMTARRISSSSFGCDV